METPLTDNMVMLAGEITVAGKIDHETTEHADEILSTRFLMQFSMLAPLQVPHAWSLVRPACRSILFHL